MQGSGDLGTGLSSAGDHKGRPYDNVTELYSVQTTECYPTASATTFASLRRLSAWAKLLRRNLDVEFLTQELDKGDRVHRRNIGLVKREVPVRFAIEVLLRKFKDALLLRMPCAWFLMFLYYQFMR